MNKGHVKVNNILFCLAVLLLVSGCTSMQTMSNYARSGDTVTIAIGGSENHVKVPILKQEDLTVTITDAANVVHPVKVRYVFRVYPDPTSRYMHPLWGVINNEYQWMAIVDLVDPATDNPLPLAAGPAIIALDSVNIQTHKLFGVPTVNGEIDSVDIEILAGTGSSNPLNYMQAINKNAMYFAIPGPQVEVKPSRQVLKAEGLIVSGGEFVFSYVDSSFERDLMAVPTTSDRYTQIAANRISQGDGTSLLKVIITNPNGFVASDSIQPLGRISPFNGLSFSLFWWPLDGQPETVTDANWQDHIQLVSGKYVDRNGDLIPDLSPVLTKVR